MKRIPNEELDYNEDGLYYYEGGPFSGISTFRGKDGFCEAEHAYREGMRWGISKGWFAPSFQEYEEEWSQGLLHGSRREWYEEGQLASEEMFEYGVRLWGKRWDKTGQLLDEFILHESDPNFAILQLYRVAYRKAGLEQHPSSAPDQ